MKDHVWVEMPQEYRDKCLPGEKTHEACWKCGLYRRGTSHNSCEAMQGLAAMARYQKGGMLDPFEALRSYQVGEHAYTGQPILAGAPETLATYTHEYNDEEPKKETRPGLVSEEIDKAAYDDFMRGL